MEPFVGLFSLLVLTRSSTKKSYQQETKRHLSDKARYVSNALEERVVSLKIYVMGNFQNHFFVAGEGF